MKQQTNRNRRWVLASRPHGAPQMDNFRLEEDDVATLSIGRDAVLAATRIKPGRPGAAGEGECYVAASSFNTTLSVESAVTGAVRWISATRRRTPNQPATSRIAISGNEAIV